MRPRSILLLLLPVLLLTAAAAPASTASLVADLKPGVRAFDPVRTSLARSYASVNGRVVFFTIEATDGSERVQCALWSTDGTPEGTERLLDFCDESFNPPSFYLQVLASNGEVALFSDGSLRLWRTDGTAAGTFPLRNVTIPQTGTTPVPGPDGRTFIFSGCTEAEGCEPWVSDGTREGTRMIHALQPGSKGSDPNAFTLSGRRVLFGATTPRGHGLWTTDGSRGATLEVVRTSHPVQRILPLGRHVYIGVWAYSEAELLVLDERTGASWKVFETYTDYRHSGLTLLGAAGRVFIGTGDSEDLYVTDGTRRGTRLLGQLSFVRWALPFGQRVVFEGNRSSPHSELWYLDPEMRSPRPFRDCPGGCPRLEGVPPVLFRDRVFFSGWDPTHGREPWVSDGTPQGTRLLADLCPGSCDSRPSHFSAALGRVIFSTAPGDLYATDGTTAGTVRFASRQPDDYSYDPGFDLAEVDGRIVFTGFDPLGGLEPWASDLTPAGSEPILSLGDSLGAGSNVSSMTPFGDKVLFTACDEDGSKMWVSDGAAAGPVQLPVAALPCQNRFLRTTVAGNLAFFDWDGKVWRTDGTPAGTFSLVNFSPGTSGFPFLGDAMTIEGQPFFVLNPSPDAPPPGEVGWVWEFWTSDGTPEGTRLAFRYRFAGTPYAFTVVGGEAFFIAQVPEAPFPSAVWRTDGTAEGTRPLLSLDSRWATARVDAVPLNGKTYFVAESASRRRGTDLWVTDGTAEGTAPVLPDVADPGRPRNLSKLTVFKGALYFFAETRDPARRIGLWRSDGTAAGTVLVKAITLPPYLYGGTYPPLLTPLGDALFFRADDGVHSTELWKTDGTPGGTVLVRDVNPGAAHSQPDHLTAAGGRLWFTANDGEHGIELWESDGTPGGTRLVQDVLPGFSSSSPTQLTPAGDSLFFTANDRVHGRELWELPLNP
jgi:ELWxxDGT repeat protein